ncbi:GNAT family N-acetyltransferase [Virgibacillus sp. 179-BFC.A HS]|uniref:GNAT family N-acetyltransferase n=1 Tax=Tigheibacillus jepli TaxID=3035914 RepID=A0ABU5CKE8_9BACI|nr:GNAT family N-acetyltransferase [Virgibacillus sp. 179-BFC.A HS]MDY0406317.1 GNAT family N-acetyltransferase [Virgibacillus sp. 179-BFC.A HS]
MKEYVKEKEIQSVSIVLSEKDALNTEYPSVLKAFGYQKQETQYFYKRDLSSFDEPERKESPIEIKSMEQTTSDIFKRIWKEASAGSLNASSTLCVETEFEGMKSELGPDYTKSCLTAFYENNPIGVTMPHIEPGTIDEGRLFYFGIIPKYRDKGWGAALHKHSLHLLKKMGATYYIGATGHKNTAMQRIFQTNGCKIFEKKYTYTID